MKINAYILAPTKYDSCRGIDALHPSAKNIAEVVIEFWDTPAMMRTEHYHLCKACLRELLYVKYAPTKDCQVLTRWCIPYILL